MATQRNIAGDHADRQASYRGWMVVLLSFGMLLISAGPVFYAYGNYAVAFSEEFGASKATINLGYTATMLVSGLAAVPVGLLISRWPIHRLAVAGAVGAALGFAMIGSAGSYLAILAIFGTLIALADAFMGNVVTNYLISHWFERRRGFAIGLSVLGASAAAIVFPPLTNLLIEAIGWRSTFFVYAGLFLIAAVPMWILARLPEAMPETERLEPATAPKLAGAPLRLGEALRRPSFWVISLVVSAMLGANSAIVVSMASYTVDQGLAAMAGSMLLSVTGAAAVIGKVGFGLAADRLRKPSMLRLGVLLQIAGLIILTVAADYSAMLLAAVLFGLGLGGMLPMWGASLASEFELASYGRVLGWSRAVMAPISLACPMAAGVLVDLTGDYRTIWGALAIMLAFAFAGTWFWRERG